MKKIFSTLVGQFTTTLNNSNMSYLGNHAPTTNLLGFTNNLLLKNVEVSVVGAPGLRKHPEFDLFMNGYFSLKFISIGDYFNNTTNTFVKTTDPNFAPLTYQYNFIPYDFEYKQPLNYLIPCTQRGRIADALASNSGNFYTCYSRYTNIQAIQPGPDSTYLAYDSLGINSIYLNRAVRLNFLFEVETV